MLNSNGGVVGSQLYGPYGNTRYSNGTLPTSIGFTGQRADSVTGLDYYVARYYDPVVGVFLSPDSVQGNAQGMQPYAYVGGNPETRTDPTGHRFICPDCGSGGGSSGGGVPPSPSDPPPVGLGHGGGGHLGGGGGRKLYDGPGIICYPNSYAAACQNQPPSDPGDGNCYSGASGHNGVCNPPPGCKTVNCNSIANIWEFIAGFSLVAVAVALAAADVLGDVDAIEALLKVASAVTGGVNWKAVGLMAAAFRIANWGLTLMLKSTENGLDAKSAYQIDLANIAIDVLGMWEGGSLNAGFQTLGKLFGAIGGAFANSTNNPSASWENVSEAADIVNGAVNGWAGLVFIYDLYRTSIDYQAMLQEH